MSEELESQESVPENPSRYVSEYRPLVSWAYRRAAWPVHTPAITQHLGYWFRTDVNVEDRKKISEHRKKIFDLFTKHVIRHQDLNCTCEIPSDADHDKSSPNETRNERWRYETYRLTKDDWHGLPVKISLEKHQEYFTVTTAIELACLAKAPERDSLLGADARLSIERIESTMKRRYTEVKGTLRGEPLHLGRLFSRDREDATDKARDDLRGAYHSIFVGIWEKFYAEFFQVPTANMGQAFREDKTPNGIIFADFRGLIVSCSADNGPFFHNDRLSDLRTRSARVFSKQESVHRAYAILPFMTAESDNTVAAALEKELSISRFLDGRCIYASTLGAQPPESTAQEQPLTYFALTSNIDSWQSGRLVDRVQTLGTLRLAARRYLGQLRNAATKLHKMEIGQLKEINDDLSKMIVQDGVIGKTRDDLVGAATDLEKIRNDVVGGLPYRVERSRYYRSQFKSLVTALRIGDHGRIEGFQPYHEFVERRFGSAYDFIDMVGTRFSRLEQQLSATNQRVRTADTARLQGVINEQTTRIKKFQDVAEIGFFSVLAPYYLGKIMAEGILPALLYLFSGRYLPPGTEPTVLTWSIAVSEILGISFLVYQRKHKSGNEPGPSDSSFRANPPTLTGTNNRKPDA